MRTAGSQRTLATLLLASSLALVAACQSSGEGTPSPSGGPQVSHQATQETLSPVLTPTGQPENCHPGEGPPSTGSGGADLGGRIIFVRLVFGCNPEVYIMSADGSGATDLSNDPSLDDEPDLSPDGKKVVFFSLRQDNRALLYLMNADGSGVRPLTGAPGGDTAPRWSPDGSRIAFSRSGSLAVMNADGSDLNIIMEAQPADSAEPCRAGSFVGGWSPDGKRITYYAAVIRSGSPNEFWVCAIDADGSNLQVLVYQPGTLNAEPSWSPDGNKIVFRSDRDGACSQAGTGNCNYEIYVLDLATGEQRNITNNPAFDIEPNWSPDGQWIAFASNRDDRNFDLYVVRPDGSDLRRLLDDPGAKDSYPGWVR